METKREPLQERPGQQQSTTRQSLQQGSLVNVLTMKEEVLDSGAEGKSLRLLQLRLSNFKGIKDFTLDIDGRNASIMGNNATGKTSLFDAFVYLLFGKDSDRKSVV